LAGLEIGMLFQNPQRISTLRSRVAMRCGFWNSIPISSPAN